MIDWVSENKFAVIVLVGLILFFVMRDLIRFYVEKKTRDMLKSNMADSERRIDALMDALHKDRLKFRDELAEIDTRFSTLKKTFPNPENPSKNVK